MFKVIPISFPTIKSYSVLPGQAKRASVTGREAAQPRRPAAAQPADPHIAQQGAVSAHHSPHAGLLRNDRL